MSNLKWPPEKTFKYEFADKEELTHVIQAYSDEKKIEEKQGGMDIRD